MTHWALVDNTAVEIIDFVDDYSRLVVAAVVVPVATAADVVSVFYKAAGIYGFSASMLTDNGGIFTASFRNGRCGFETELATLGIKANMASLIILKPKARSNGFIKHSIAG